MAHSAAPGLPLPATALLQDWGCRGPPDPEGYSSSSPAPSPDSCGLSSPAAARGPCRGPPTPRLRGGPGGRKGVRGAGGPRQSASEREKLRMRRLAQALRRLRHYLPPALVPAGQSLTKIETLRLAIRYIAHLSALLGLSQEALARRRGAAPRHCPLCPQGLGCCQTPDPRLHPPADASPPGTVGWGSPPMVGTPPELHGTAGMGRGAWGSPPCGSVVGSPQEMLGAPDMGMEAWGSPHYIPVGGTPPELHGAVTSNTSSWLSPPHCAGAGAPPDLPGDPLLDAGLMLPEIVDAGTVTQDLSTDLLSLLEALLPPQPQD
ncbi:PREDICTED: mesoderm posterior protein 1-like [Calidris pugnax]|uniref:mesoderm posterior protein 1-like n=1 Tax=Calidris pugnax TaxID=198806 RepID=UPI00071CBB70|nr:PREDICTED: mesoderm posterior protein 1-like [Calidris pugnax]